MIDSPKLSHGDLRERFNQIRTWKRGGERAVHKPLLILLALSRLQNSQERWLSFRVVEKTLADLLRDFGPPRTNYRPEYPFWRLQSDGIWEVRSDTPMIPRRGNTDPKKSELLEKNASAGFSGTIFDEFERHPEQIGIIARFLLDTHFPETVQADLIDLLHLTFASDLRSQATRDPQFRREVLQAYGYRCAICGYELRLGSELVGVEAAHIRWVQAQGPDTTNNGISMCSLHHKLFDRGAFSIDPKRRVIVCSKELIDRGASTYLYHLHGKPISLPIDLRDAPLAQFLEWHDREVFRKPGLPIS